MRNFIARGDVLTLPNSLARAVASGEGVLIDRIFGVSANNFSATDDVVINVVGVFELPKTASQAWTVGQRVYWDSVNRVVTGTATGNNLIGVAVAAVGGGAGETLGRVRLNGSF
jgi:predicted RecA/RadA family phage recombinase